MIGTAVGYVLIECMACCVYMIYFVSRLRKAPCFSTMGGAERYLVRLNLDLAVDFFFLLRQTGSSVACILYFQF